LILQTADHVKSVSMQTLFKLMMFEQ